jgi:uncharacterized protein involved in exopolysaccharide biosynthesis
MNSELPPPASLADVDAHDDDAGPAESPSPFDWATLLLRSAGRRWWIAGLVFLFGSAAITTYFVKKKPTYQVEARILAQRQQAFPSVARSGYEDVPTRSAWELVHRRENLVSLIRIAKVLADEDGSRVPRKLSLGQRLASLAGREVTLATEDPMDVFVAALDKRLGVTVEEGTITLTLDWPDPKQAYDIVQGALENFMDARYIQEVRAIDEVISVVQGRAAALRADLDAAMDDARRRTVRLPRPTAPRARPPTEELVRLQSLFESKQRAILDVEEFRRRRVADLQAQLDQARNTLSDAHPKVVGLRKDIEAASRETPQLEGLREEERSARKAYSERLAREGAASPAAAAPTTDFIPVPGEEDPRVRQLRLQYEQMILRVNAAQVELDAARAAFKYRYNVIWPPQLPTEPISPNPRKIFGAGLAATLLLALLLAAAPDLLSGRLLERWQLERVLRVPIVGDVSGK